MVKSVINTLSDRAIWFLVGSVFFCVLLVLVIVFSHNREKPESPQALVAAAFNQVFPIQEWKPGMGKQPFMYHPVGFKGMVWRPLPLRPRQVGTQTYPGPWPQHRFQYNQWNRFPGAVGGRR